MGIRQQLDADGKPLKNKYIITCDKPFDYLTGKRKQHFERFTGTYKQAAVRENELLTYYARLNNTIAIDVRFLAYEKWLPYARSYRNIAGITEKIYTYHLEKYILPQIGEVLLHELKPAHLEAVLSSVSVAFAPKIFATMRAMFNYAEDKDLIDKSPARKCELPRQTARRKEKNVYFLEEIPDVLRAIRGSDIELGVIYCIFGGLRIEEMLAQDKPHADWDGFIVVDKAYSHNGETWELTRLKSKASYRSDFPLVGTQLERVLELSDGCAGEPLIIAPRFNERMNRESFYKRWRALCADHSLKYVQPKDLRATFATLLSRQMNAEDIASLLGHADKGTTASAHYIQPDRKKNKDIAEILSQEVAKRS